jgi:geranylgeranyl pyrophosphate synthase
VGEMDIDQALIELRKYFTETGVLDSAKNLVQKYTLEAQNNLEVIPKDKRAHLEQLTEYVWKRKK